MASAEKNSYAFASNNNYYSKGDNPQDNKYSSSDRTLGSNSQAHFTRFPDPEGEKATGINFVAFSLLMSDGGIIDYDSDTFSNEEEAQAYCETLAQENSGHSRKSIVVPVEQRAETEMKIINMINNGDPNKGDEHSGALPNSPNKTATVDAFFSESKLQKLKYLKSL
jgi:hypothetical protein